jgi:hypothetical protein
VDGVGKFAPAVHFTTIASAGIVAEIIADFAVFPILVVTKTFAFILKKKKTIFFLCRKKKENKISRALYTGQE